MKTLVLLTLSVLVFADTNASTVVTDFFVPTGTTEHLVASFNHSTEATTTTSYNGYVLLQFTGSGNNNPSHRKIYSNS